MPKLTVVLDDKLEVWKDAANVVKIVPYKYFKYAHCIAQQYMEAVYSTLSLTFLWAWPQGGTGGE